MPVVTFSVFRDAGDENRLTFGGVFTVGPNTGSAQYFFSPGQTYGYSTSGSGPGSVALRIDSSTQIGLDDRQGAGADGDYNDLIVRITSGNATFGGGGMFVNYDAVNISSFTANPNPQNSSAGSPQYSTTLSWSSTGGTSATITSSAGESWNVGTSGSLTITNLPQSTAGSNSPATRSYTLRVSNPQFSQSSSLTVSVRNDNTPSNSWTTSFSNLEPNTVVDLTLGSLSGVDMPTTISTSGSGNFVGASGSFSGSRNFNNGNTVQLRTTTLGFNTDTTGSTGIYGKANTKTVTVNTPSGSFNVSVSTRAPRIREDFDYANRLNVYPYEDIDLITNTPTEYTTSAQITANDIEISQEIKVDQPDAQISINGGGWQNVRSI
jgi:hypothetical protein